MKKTFSVTLTASASYCEPGFKEKILDYKLTSPSLLPSAANQECEKLTKSAELCVYWHEIGKLKSFDDTVRFPNLTCLAKCVLALLVSNADTERVFSIIRKIVINYRTELEPSTLCALVAIVMAYRTDLKPSILCALVACKLNSNDP